VPTLSPVNTCGPKGALSLVGATRDAEKRRQLPQYPRPRINMNHMNPGKASRPRESTSPLVTPSGALSATCEDWRSKISPHCYLCRPVVPKRIDPNFSVVIDRSGFERLHAFIRVTRSIAFTLAGSSSQRERAVQRWRYFLFEPPVSLVMTVKITVPSESLTFHSVR
jgi:hypothetical protein